MGVQQSTPFPAIAFSRNPIPCVLASDDYLASNGVAAVSALKVNGPVAAGATILLQWANVKLLLTATAGEPTDEQIPAGSGDAAYVQSLLPLLATHYLIDKDFTVALNGQQLVFTARQTGAYALASFVTGNLETFLITPGVARAMKPNFCHHLEVWVRQLGAAGFEKAYDYNVELDYPVTGESFTDIGPEVLHSFLDPDLPVLTGQNATACVNSVAEYYVRYAQYFGSVPTVKRLITSPIARVAMGGLSLYAATQRNIISELCPDPNDETKNNFMRLGSRVKLVTAEQPEWLYFLNLKPAQRAIGVEVRIYYSDDTDLAFDVAQTPANTPAYGKYQVPAGYNQLGIAGRAPAEKLPVYYTIRLKAATGYISAPYSFILDYTWQEQPRYFVYLNAYGAYQTLATTGKGQTGAGRTAESARIGRPARVAAVRGEYLEYNIKTQDKGTVNIGYDRIGKRVAALLRDFFSSRSIFLYEYGKLIPVGLSSTSLNDAPDGDDLFAGSFEYYFLNEEDQYTEDPGLPDDDLYQLLLQAGSPVPPLVPGSGSGSGSGEDFDEIIDDPDFNDDEFYDDTE